MATVVIIEDDFHAEWQGEYASIEGAFEELKRRATLAWDQSPNRCPCTSWETCHRDYQILEYENSGTPWTQIRRFGYLEVSGRGATWVADFKDGCLPKDA